MLRREKWEKFGSSEVKVWDHASRLPLDKRLGQTEEYKPPSEQFFGPFRTLQGPLSPAARASSLASGADRLLHNLQLPVELNGRLTYACLRAMSRCMGVAILELPEPAARAFGKLRRVRRSLHTSRAVGGARRAHPNSRGDGWPATGWCVI